MDRYKIVYLLLWAVFLSACGGGVKKDASQQEEIDSIPMLVLQIQKCSKLYTSEYQLHKIVTYDDTMSVKGKLFHQSFKINLPLGKRRIAIPVKANVKAYVDFGDFSEKNVKKHGNKIEIILPDPEVVLTATQIDHEGVRQKVSFFRKDFSDEEITRIQQQGRDAIIKSMPRLGIIENARQNTANQIIPIIEQLGYRPEDVTITFRKRFTISDIPSLIKQTET